MRFLHTSDWHVGKVLKGRSRLDEHARVLAEIVGVAAREQVDAVLIAGDLYDTSAPSPEAQRLVVHALLRLRAVGAEVLVVAGNHDNAATFDAYRPLMAAAGISVLGQPRPPADIASATSFAAGAVLPVILAALAPVKGMVVLVAAGSLALLALLGGLAAWAGGASELIGAARITFWGALAMGLTAAVGAAFGTNG